MPKIIRNNPEHVRKFMWLNIALGVSLFAVMFFFITTGQYENLAVRTQNEVLLNNTAIGALIYAAFFFILDAFTAPHLQTQK